MCEDGEHAKRTGDAMLRNHLCPLCAERIQVLRKPDRRKLPATSKVVPVQRRRKDDPTSLD